MYNVCLKNHIFMYNVCLKNHIKTQLNHSINQSIVCIPDASEVEDGASIPFLEDAVRDRIGEKVEHRNHERDRVEDAPKVRVCRAAHKTSKDDANDFIYPVLRRDNEREVAWYAYSSEMGDTRWELQTHTTYSSIMNEIVSRTRPKFVSAVPHTRQG